MHIPRLPDWLVYATVVAALVMAAEGRREREDAPVAPTPPPGLAQAPIAPSSPFAATRVWPVSDSAQRAAGAAFSVGGDGLWLTAAQAIGACATPGVVVAQGRGVAAKVVVRQADLALLSTQGGAPPLPLAPIGALGRGEQMFHPGFPQGDAGELASRVIGRRNLRPAGREARPRPTTVLAEDGRTEGLEGSLAGLVGGPVLNGAGQVVGVTLANAPRRGLLYAATPDAIRSILAVAHVPSASLGGAPVTAENYGRAADALRRDLRVAPLVCLPI